YARGREHFFVSEILECGEDLAAEPEHHHVIEVTQSAVLEDRSEDGFVLHRCAALPKATANDSLQELPRHPLLCKALSQRFWYFAHGSAGERSATLWGARRTPESQALLSLMEQHPMLNFSGERSLFVVELLRGGNEGAIQGRCSVRAPRLFAQFLAHLGNPR